MDEHKTNSGTSPSSSPKLDTVVDRIQAVMIDAGVKPRQIKSKIAEICGIKVQSVHGWFNGTTKSPSAENIAALSVHYDSDAVWLITGKFSSTEKVCERLQAATPDSALAHNCNLDSEVLEAKDVTVTRKFIN